MYQFQKLVIWQDSVEIVKNVYAVIKLLPAEEKYGLSSQIQRAVTSVSLNIAEGKGSGYDKEFARFLSIALRSLHETVAALILATELGYLREKDIENLLISMDKLGGKIKALINKLNSHQPVANSK